MKGITIRKRMGKDWMRVGKIAGWLEIAAFAGSILAALGLLAWLISSWQENRNADLAMGLFLLALLPYAMFSAEWHEKRHARAYAGTPYESRVSVRTWWTKLIFRTGYVKVRGPVEYSAWKKSTLAPLWDVLIFGLIAGAGIWIPIPGWIPAFTIFAILALMSMGHDFYWLISTRKIGSAGKYWDRGSELHVVWNSMDRK